ncbi:hypothetical protein H6G93_06190 [Nostoc sp. FACHB-973]|uniref:Uncharacterized protein n=1 Tax=Desmonostoc muscorum LEGE 12446 TaxID=1828758 RepID=A0A8J6ZU20_DESMC|nr:hypothetical protein [Desmonostoc muscorum]MBD2514603.1 hypothetical protein [Nostoc sp. FACHB-973]MBX9256032.1 hypothetical protein [Desmonostoc muscorum CCALA 125]MCF2145259.1 hypothetical protein [Desmonostoc muscorum LEGE 12446]
MVFSFFIFRFDKFADHGYSRLPTSGLDYYYSTTEIGKNSTVVTLSSTVGEG